MHALGMKHEQSRTDRDENIKILTNNIKDGKVGNFNKGKTVDTRPYDAESVMQYNLYVSSVVVCFKVVEFTTTYAIGAFH
jgi:hypothetical protein